MYRMIRKLSGGLCCWWAVNGGALPCVAGTVCDFQVSFVKVADTATRIPNDAGTFSSFDTTPSLSGENATFYGGSAVNGGWGVYRWRGEALELVANGNTPIPGGSGNFGTFLRPKIDGDRVAFGGYNSNEHGMYTDLGGSVRVVADRRRQMPGTAVNFQGFGEYALIRGGSVAFFGYGPTWAYQGMYIETGGTIVRVVDRTMAAPGGSGNFGDFDSRLAFDGRDIAFRGSTYTPDEGIYTTVGAGGGFRRVARVGDVIPGRATQFTFVDDPAIDGGRVAFWGTDGAYSSTGGIHVEDGAGGRDGSGGNGGSRGGGLRIVADGNTPIPGGGGATFQGLGHGNGWYFSFDEGRIAFVGFWPGTGIGGLYIDIDGTLCKIIGPNDLLDGKRLQQASIGAQSLDGNRIVFQAYFTDGSRGIYIATMDFPCEPPTITLQPRSVAACAGDSIMLSVAASGDGASYQWRHNGVSIPGATADSLLIEAATTDDGGSYDVEISNSCGSIITDAATVVVWPTGTGDVNGDGRLDGLDVAGFVEVLLSATPETVSLAACAADLDGDEAVTMGDVGLFVGRLIAG